MTRRMAFGWTTVAGLALAATSGAAGIKGQPVYAENARRIPVVRAAYVSPMGPDGRAVHWQRASNAPSREAPSWQVAFDSMSTNPTTLAPYSNVYGASSGPQRLSNHQKNFMFCNDMTLAPNTGGKVAKFIRIGLVWNPNGTDPRSGSADCMVRVYAAGQFDDTAFGPAFSQPLSGVVGIFPNLGSDTPAYLEFNLANLAGGVMLPASTGALVVEVGTVGPGNSFEPLTGLFAAQPLLSNMVSPGEPQFPGTNPSGSSDLQWDDDSDPGFPGANKPDYVFQDFTNTAGSGFPFAELYGYDATGDGLGILQAAAALFVDQNSRSISGRVSFQDFAEPSAAPKTATFEIRLASSGTLIDVQTAPLGTDGSYSIVDPRFSTGGVYLIGCKASHWLRQAIVVDTTGLADVVGKDYSLINGDVDDDNAVTVFDYNALSDAFDTAEGDANWNPMADLDGDGGVTVFDYNILSANFDMVGD